MKRSRNARMMAVVRALVVRYSLDLDALVSCLISLGVRRTVRK